VTLKMGSAAVDCGDLDAMVSFWSQVLGYRPHSRGRGWMYLVHPQDEAPGLFLQRVPDPTPGKNRWHVDLYTPTRKPRRPASRGSEALECGSSRPTRATSKAPSSP
jgi:hypothetical protein